MLACAGLAFLDPTSPARALADAMQGVASRDIKLENTLLDNSPRPLIKLADFGCEWRRGRDPLHAGGPRGGGSFIFLMINTRSFSPCAHSASTHTRLFT